MLPDNPNDIAPDDAPPTAPGVGTENPAKPKPEAKPETKPVDERAEARQLLEASALAWMFPIAIALGALWGWGMDRWFGTWPWLTAIFTGFGVIAAFINLFRIGMRE